MRVPQRKNKIKTRKRIYYPPKKEEMKLKFQLFNKINIKRKARKCETIICKAQALFVSKIK